jgi:serine phosphatase RsbU (regulator of sigma subunit)
MSSREEARVAGLAPGVRSVTAVNGADEGPQESAPERDRGAWARLDAAERRDAEADDRDVAATARDRAADARDRVIAAAGHAQAAEEYRTLAAHDRHAAASDREQAARERRHALLDREALVLELQRERRRRDAELLHRHRAERLAQTLQRSLSPPVLPRIAGLDVAAHYEFFATEEVGGDFYDLFPLSGGRLGFFLGDVCGKGPEAAAVTSLARYTMRTAAMLHQGPVAVLEELNAALLMAAGDMLQLCTAVYGELDMSSGNAAITLAAGGHPAPLIVRADGAVDITDARGTLLGAVADPSFVTCDVVLAPGDTIVVHSDGILDVQLDGRPMDEKRTASLLEGERDAGAQSIVDRLVRALRRADRPLRDDIAIMAVRRAPG